MPVIALAQLNRESAKGAGSKPSMADLRDSGSVEQDADVVILLYRNPNDPDPVTAGEIHLMTVKNRHGSIDSVKYLFDGRHARIVSPPKS